MSSPENPNPDDISSNEANFERLAQKLTKIVYLYKNRDGTVTKFTSYSGIINTENREDKNFNSDFLDALKATGRDSAFHPLILPVGNTQFQHFGTVEPTDELVDDVISAEPQTHVERFTALATQFFKKTFSDTDTEGIPFREMVYTTDINPFDQNSRAFLSEFQIRAAINGFQNTDEGPQTVSLGDNLSRVHFMFRDPVRLNWFTPGKFPPLRPSQKQANFN